MARNGVEDTSLTSYDSSLGSETTADAGRIRQLEAEVQDLADRANGASQRFADYENEIRVLQAQLRQAQRRNAAAEQDGTSDPPPAPERKLSRFGSLMHVRKTLPSQTQAPTSREKELEAALLKEQNARIAAEQRVKTADAEIEELSQSLFQEANEMVAEERRKNAMLLQRIEALERPPMSNRDDAISSLRSENLRLHERLQAMEHREADRRRRLDKLESAFTRIERVKSILLPR